MRTILFSLLFFLSIGPAQAQEGGYASSTSVYQGDTITLFISTSSNVFDLRIRQFGAAAGLDTMITSLKGGYQTTRDSSYRYGCGWQPTISFRVPATWRSGVYIGEFPRLDSATMPIIFVVKEGTNNRREKVLFDLSFNTYIAYDNFGGKSSYSAYSTDNTMATRLSFLRPLVNTKFDNVHRADFAAFEGKILQWLDRNHYPADVCTDVDLDKDSSYLFSYDVLIISGHNEYWSMGMRKNVARFIQRGGRVMFLGGNICWWQIRYEDDHTTFVCYKSNPDPVKDRSLATTNWIYLGNRENTLTGLSYENGGQVNYGGVLEASKGYGGFLVYNAHHWMFRSTGLSDGAQFGWRSDSAIVGYEVDAAKYMWQRGLPIPTGEDKTPSTFIITGLSPANTTTAPYQYPTPGHWGTMGLYYLPHGGHVFNASTIRWARGLSYDTTATAIITKNVLDRFLRNEFPPDIIEWSPARIVPDSQLYMRTFLNRRDTTIRWGRKLKFSMKATDPDDRAVQYLYRVGANTVSRSSNYILESQNWSPGNHTVIGMAYNDVDTTTLSWKITIVPGSGVAITSEPDSDVNTNEWYQYDIEAASISGDSLEYLITDLPSWLQYNAASRTISGMPTRTDFASSSQRVFRIIARSVANASDADTQYVSLRIRNINHPPSTLKAFYPANADTIHISPTDYSVVFTWGMSDDIDHDPITYALHVRNVDSRKDTILWTSDTVRTLSLTRLYRSRSKYEWSIDVTDGYDTVFSNIKRTFFVSGVDSPTSTGSNLIPAVAFLDQNYPNPFNPSTIITYGVPHRSQVTVDIYNMLGQLENRIVNAVQSPGIYHVAWNPDGPSGVYLCRVMIREIESNGTPTMLTRKMIKVK